MNVIFADPALMSNLGHNANSCRHIVNEARLRHIPTAVLAYFEVESELCTELMANPWFRCNTYAVYDEDPLCGWLSNFDFVADRTFEDLSRLHGLGRDDLIFFNTAAPGQLMGMLRWLKSIPVEQRPTLIVEFGLFAGMQPVQTELGTQLAHSGDPRPVLLRYIVKKLLTPEDRDWLFFATFDPQSSAIYETMLNFPVRTLPLSNRAVTDCRDRTGTRPITIAFLGHQRESKGYDMVPELVGRLLSLLPDIRVLVHNGDPESCLPQQNALKAIAVGDPRLILDERTADPALWSQLLEQSDLVVCPYWRDVFVSTYSALASEAIANAIPLVVPSRTTMANLLQQFGSPGIVYDDPLPRSGVEFVLQGIMTAVYHFDTLATRAKVASQMWDALNGPAPLLNTLLSWHTGRPQ
ncbi:MAG: glycosyltransferase [Magnetococcales bacterium]|nr:glycosyltransferase [Magnetococcales bacterium]